MEGRVVKWGNSLAIRIPRSVASEVRLEEGAAVDVRVEDNAMVVRKTEDARVDLAGLLRKVTKTNVHGEVSTGRRKGREAW
jgi:antitoxin MazE